MMMVVVMEVNKIINSHGVACSDDGDGGDDCTGNHITKTPYMIL